MWHSQHVLYAHLKTDTFFAAPYRNTGEFVAVVITLMYYLSTVRGQSATCETMWHRAPGLTKKGDVREGPVSSSTCVLLVTVTWQRLLFCLIILDSIFLWERQTPHWLFIWEAILSLRNYPCLNGLHAWVGLQDPMTQTSLKISQILDEF